MTIIISGFAHIFSFSFKWSQNFEILSQNDKFGTLSHKLFPKWLFCAIFVLYLLASFITKNSLSISFIQQTSEGFKFDFARTFFHFRPGLGEFDRLGRLTLK